MEENALAQLEIIKQSTDIEVRHIEADKLLCDLLRELGFGKLIDSYEDEYFYKWYS